MPSLPPQRNPELIRRLDLVESPPSAVAIGNFDGLHRGHGAVIDIMRQAAADLNVVPSVLTFEPHPRRLFAPETASFRLEPLAMKLRRLRDAGVRQVFMPRFDRAFASMSAMQFLDDVLGDRLHARAVVTGENFAFGHGRSGSVTMLKDWGARNSVAIHTVPPVMAENEICSSSAVRHALARGDVAHAGALLGHPYQLNGRVIHGDGRGRALGFPTANVTLAPRLKLPLHGIYAVRALVQAALGAKQYDGAASIGVRPTIGPQDIPTLEVHLFDFAGDIYGAKIEVQFFHWLRPEEKFASLDALTQQMAKDCIEARERLQGPP
jgi:riboflavin kinase/FMN adenylyltransferase